MGAMCARLKISDFSQRPFSAMKNSKQERNKSVWVPKGKKNKNKNLKDHDKTNKS